MRPFVLCSLLALAAGLAAFGVTRWLSPAPAANHPDEVAWVCREFHLDAAQSAQVQQLHAAYAPVCMEHCAQIRATSGLLADLEKSNQRDTPGYAAVTAELSRLEAVCTDATQAHLQAVAAVMPPAEAARFLALVGPKVSASDHRAPPVMRP